MFLKTIAIPLLGCGEDRDDTSNGPYMLLETLYEYSIKFPRKNRTLERIKIYTLIASEYTNLMLSAT